MSRVQDAPASLASLLATATSLSPEASSAVSSMLWNAHERDQVAETGNPYLAVLPAFTYAMPVQVVILGVTVTLLGVLLVHLLFTIRYHLPLSKVNYAFQTTAVVLSLCNLAAQLHLVMHSLYKIGRSWPFYYDYIEIAIPPTQWSQAKRGAWLFLQGLTSLITHATHIQFLTMLFPSALEARLILGLLGPLAFATAGLTFTSLSPHAAVVDLGDAIRNTANSSLTLLYTLALFIWGLTLNRKRAWRTDGGTATFGILALILGVLGTAVNFVEIREDRMRWLPGVVTCVLLWQSWVGFWWWVGAGMWTGEAEDVERRQAKKRRRAEAKKLKKEAREREARGETTGTSVAGGGGSVRRRGGGGGRRADAEGEEIELRELGGAPPPPPPPRPTRPAVGGSHPSSASVSSGSTPPPSNHFYSPILAYFAPFFARLRVAHDAAAVAKAALPPGLPDDVRRGWGIKALMNKGKRERAERREAAVGAGAGGEVDASERRAGFEADGGERLGGEEWEDEDESGESSDGSSDSEEEEERPRRGAGRSSAREQAYPPPPPPAPRPPRETGEEEEEEPTVDWAGRGMDGQWRGWRGAIARWRLADVSKF